MAVLPKSVIKAWKNREDAVVLATVDTKGMPNAIYATCVRLVGEDTLVVADNYFKKTRANIRAGSPGSLLFITKSGDSYQIKGRIEYHTSGPLFDDMKKWNPVKHPGRAAAILRARRVFCGAERLA